MYFIEHFEIRPTEGAQSIERWNGKGWTQDNGKPGLAFSGLDERGCPVAWYPKCDESCSFFNDFCPGRIARQRTCERFSCSNGCAIEHQSVVLKRKQAEAEMRRKEEEIQRLHGELITKAGCRGLVVIDSEYGPRITWEALQSWLDGQNDR